ncbi:MAG: DUF6675 family protein [Rectinema subterraneum]|jgi:hypothetical protein|uniref:DUF6675 family protein n=1 Tax=Rectinema subterraneum TaxID=2653714 RepID=UPI00131CB584|nr:DUF6675 family protein [Rectinema subterraneum]
MLQRTMRRAAKSWLAGCIAVLLLGLTSFVAAQPLRNVLPNLASNELARLLVSAPLLFDATDEEQVEHFIPLSKKAIFRQWLTGQDDATWLIGDIFLLENIGFSEKDRLDLVNNLAQIETIAGVTYYSETRKKTTVLFDDVYRVAAAGSSKALPSLHFEKLPESLSFIAHIQDVNFGSTWYSISIENARDSVMLTLTNARPLAYFVIKAFDKNALVMQFMIFPVDEGLLAIGLCSATPGKTVSSIVDVYSALEKRINAVQGWVSRRAQLLRATHTALKDESSQRGSP